MSLDYKKLVATLAFLGFLGSNGLFAGCAKTDSTIPVVPVNPEPIADVPFDNIEPVEQVAENNVDTAIPAVPVATEENTILSHNGVTVFEFEGEKFLLDESSDIQDAEPKLVVNVVASTDGHEAYICDDCSYVAFTPKGEAVARGMLATTDGVIKCISIKGYCLAIGVDGFGYQIHLPYNKDIYHFWLPFDWVGSCVSDIRFYTSDILTLDDLGYGMLLATTEDKRGNGRNQAVIDFMPVFETLVESDMRLISGTVIRAHDDGRQLIVFEYLKHGDTPKTMVWDQKTGKPVQGFYTTNYDVVDVLPLPTDFEPTVENDDALRNPITPESSILRQRTYQIEGAKLVSMQAHGASRLNKKNNNNKKLIRSI